MEDLFGFFKFYYYIITDKGKKYRYAYDNPLSILMTPIALFVLHMILSFIIDSTVFTLLMMAYAPLVAGNLLAFIYHNNTYQEIEIAKERAERRKKQQEEHHRMWKEAYENIERRRAERARREQQYREDFYKKYRQRQQSEYQYSGYERTYQRAKPNNNNSSSLAGSLKVLGLNANATKQDVKRAYRSLSKKHHPDAGGKQENFVKINKAYKNAISQLS